MFKKSKADPAAGGAAAEEGSSETTFGGGGSSGAAAEGADFTSRPPKNMVYFKKLLKTYLQRVNRTLIPLERWFYYCITIEKLEAHGHRNKLKKQKAKSSNG